MSPECLQQETAQRGNVIIQQKKAPVYKRQTNFPKKRPLRSHIEKTSDHAIGLPKDIVKLTERVSPIGP